MWRIQNIFTDILNDQATTLEELIHHDSIFPEGSLVLEAGSGVGAQTQIIALKNPRSNFISVDISKESLREAAATITSLGIYIAVWVLFNI